MNSINSTFFSLFYHVFFPVTCSLFPVPCVVTVAIFYGIGITLVMWELLKILPGHSLAMANFKIFYYNIT